MMDAAKVIYKGFWFRYIGNVDQTFENKTSKLSLKGRAIYALYLDKDKLFISPQDLSASYPINKGQADLLIKTSKAFTGKIQGKSANPGNRSYALTFENEPEPEAIAPAAPELVLPKISGATTVNLVALDAPVMASSGALLPPSTRVYDMVEKSMSLIGTKVKFKKPITIAVSSTVSTCLLGKKNPKRGSYDVFVVLNLSQLSMIFGTITVKNLAQVITHELGHYIMEYGVMKQTDLMKFKKLIAAKQMHKDQFNHPGYSYAWWHEAWAILCEAMVHGESCRGFTTELGYELAEKYFVNVNIKQGTYTGSYASF